jgi:hypothetical protein
MLGRSPRLPGCTLVRCMCNERQDPAACLDSTQLRISGALSSQLRLTLCIALLAGMLSCSSSESRPHQAELDTGSLRSRDSTLSPVSSLFSASPVRRHFVRCGIRRLKGSLASANLRGGGREMYEPAAVRYSSSDEDVPSSENDPGEVSTPVTQ